MLCIDIHRGASFFPELAKANERAATFCPPPEMYENLEYSPTWFEFKNAQLTPVSVTRPEIHPCQHLPKWSLLTTLPNYLVLFLVDVLYASRPDIRIEDAAGGLGLVPFYLQQRGFTNTGIIDDFSQLPREAAVQFRQHVGARFAINDLLTTPTVVNLSGLHYYPKCRYSGGGPNLLTPLHGPRSIADTASPALAPSLPMRLELFCLDIYRPREVEEDLDRCDLAPGRFQILPALARHQMVRLCHDSDGIAMAYCRPDKLEEFTSALQPYVVP